MATGIGKKMQPMTITNRNHKDAVDAANTTAAKSNDCEDGTVVRGVSLD
jgi:hypothetical protein